MKISIKVPNIFLMHLGVFSIKFLNMLFETNLTSAFESFFMIYKIAKTLGYEV
jgi:hypothetical protein